MMSNSYATDGRCHNSEAGWLNQECGKPAVWLGTKANGFSSGFCDKCKSTGREALSMVSWKKLEKSND